MSPIWFVLSLKRTTLASDEGMPDLLMTCVLGLPPCHLPPAPHGCLNQTTHHVECGYIHLLHYEPLEGRSYHLFFSFFQPPITVPGTQLESVSWLVSLLVLSSHRDTVFCGEERERKPAGKEESLRSTRACARVCARALSCSVMSDSL